MSRRHTYYDSRSVIQRESMRIIEDTLAGLGRPVDVAKFPSGHKVWRVSGLVAPPAIYFETEDHGQVRIEPSQDYTLEHMLTDWERVT